MPIKKNNNPFAFKAKQGAKKKKQWQTYWKVQAGKG